MKNLTKIFLLVLFFGLSQQAELPSYIKKCKLSDSNLSKCMIDHANEAIPVLVKGDPNFKLINMSPIVIPVVNLGSGPNLELRLNQVTTDNLKDVKLKTFNFDAKAKKFSLTSHLDVLEVISTYFINGQILVLPIKGEGNANITLVGNEFHYDAVLGVKDEGEKYYVVEKPNLKLDVERVYFKFDNLFGGNPALGKQMNDFLDQNWKEFYDELKPAIEQTVQVTITNTFNVYFSKVPISKLFD